MSNVSSDDENFAKEIQLYYERERLAQHVENSVVNMPKRKTTFKIHTIGLTPKEFTPKGVPQVSASVLKKLAGQNLFGDGTQIGLRLYNELINLSEKDIVWGDAYNQMGGGDEGREACKAIGALAAIGQIDATINNFLLPLQAKMIFCKKNIHHVFLGAR